MIGLKKGRYLTVCMGMGSFGRGKTTITASDVVASLDGSVGVVGVAQEVEAYAKKFNTKEVQVYEEWLGASLIDVLRARGKVTVDAIRRRPRTIGVDPAGESSVCIHRLAGFEARGTALGPEVQAPGILKAAAAHMEDRASQYDKPGGERSMAPTVAAFNAITGHQLSEEQGWLFMELLKCVRAEHNGYRPDNYEDGAAYVALKGEAAARNRGESST